MRRLAKTFKTLLWFKAKSAAAYSPEIRAELGHRANYKPDPRNVPQDGNDFGQGLIGIKADLDPLLQILDLRRMELARIKPGQLQALPKAAIRGAARGFDAA